jgi:hypothetical protein
LPFLSRESARASESDKDEALGLTYSKHAHAQIAGVSNRLELSLRECGIKALLAASFLLAAPLPLFSSGVR